MAGSELRRLQSFGVKHIFIVAGPPERPARFKNLPGGYSGREPPDTIPNSEVKLPSADGSVGLPHVRVGHRQAPYPEPLSQLRNRRRDRGFFR
jgi:hypothetical protein